MYPHTACVPLSHAHYRMDGCLPFPFHVDCREWLVNVSDNGFSPALLEVSSEDRVWFVWDKKQCKKGQHIVQRTRNGSESGESGISRGSKKILLTRDGCYSQLFSTPGVIYFGSLGLPSSSICTVVVRSSLNSETVTFTEGGFEPG